MSNSFCCTQDVLIREGFQKVYKITNILVVLLSILSIVYFLFWIGVTNDSYCLELGKSVFEPLAKFLNNGAEDIGIYLSTSKVCIFSALSILAIRIILSGEEKKSLEDYLQKEEALRIKEKLDILKTCTNTYDSTKAYSICLSIDYESENFVSPERKAKLNSLINEKIAKSLFLIEPKSYISAKKVLVFAASNFMNYDKIYDAILKELSLAKKVMKSKYDIKIIPSITTDAFTTSYSISEIKKQHFEIKTFNFKNRSLTTSAFSDKYKYLKQNKYAGIPIGEYVYFGNKKTGTYELNIVHKNLEKTLSQI